MALIKRILVFLLSLVCIIVFFSVTTSLYADEIKAGLGIGTRTCNDFVYQTVEINDSGELTEKALMNRLEYLQWANGFMTALNIRHYEKHKKFKDMNAVKRFNDLYNEIIVSCNFIKEDKGYIDFSIATFVVFDALG